MQLGASMSGTAAEGYLDAGSYEATKDGTTSPMRTPKPDKAP